ncbi:enoyl-CoA hydratase/isomerase family protein [Castellaniella sp.]|uniref:enoyl-CoA hydratase/isomerase family protein n=1 Tax=Castellaniella sp. TaxID=1955812 RepID=UPI003A924059
MTDSVSSSVSEIPPEPVLFEEIPSGGGRRVGVATLNSPQTLNGLSLSMCRLLDERLEAWQDNDAIAAVILRGAGEKAFCAGGDLHSLYRSMLDTPAGEVWANIDARSFFETEYRLDYRIHRYGKPIICWGGGIVMGGGVGLMLGASHRVVTGNTRFAMPEITIGLYPDVAGTWMLSRMPRGIGEFLALTGAQLGAADCLHFGLADHYCPADGLEALLEALAATEWASKVSDHMSQVDAVFDRLQLQAPEPGPLQQHATVIREVCNRSDLNQIGERLARFRVHTDPWLVRAANTFLAGSPGSARLSHTLLRRARHQSLADVFRMEYIASLHCCAEPDFREGIRALLIDKDKSPRWRPATLEQASPEWVRRFFAQPWPGGQVHPLADLRG